MAFSSKSEDRVRGLPLSSAMRSLLGAVLSVIDRRLLSIEEATLWGNEEGRNLVPNTCDTCCGTGFILVDGESEVSDENVESEGDTEAAFVSAASPSVPPPFSSSSSAPPTALASAPVATQSTAVSTAVTPAVAGGAPPAVPQPSTIIPGFHSLGENHPVPRPTEAVFCTEADGPPFYSVTRGKRVGCFGGWEMVSPYVVKAGGVVFNKKPSLVAAYEAYTKAYDRGSVQYT